MPAAGASSSGFIFTTLDETPVTNEDFASGDAALFIYPRSGGAKFFHPVIVQP